MLLVGQLEDFRHVPGRVGESLKLKVAEHMSRPGHWHAHLRRPALEQMDAVAVALVRLSEVHFKHRPVSHKVIRDRQGFAACRRIGIINKDNHVVPGVVAAEGIGAGCRHGIFPGGLIAR